MGKNWVTPVLCYILVHRLLSVSINIIIPVYYHTQYMVSFPPPNDFSARYKGFMSCANYTTSWEIFVNRWLISPFLITFFTKCILLPSLQGPTLVGTGSGTPEVPELPCAWGYSWATLSPGVINTETWSSRLGVGRGANNPTP
jgi:hypothetical protein